MGAQAAAKATPAARMVDLIAKRRFIGCPFVSLLTMLLRGDGRIGCHSDNEFMNRIKRIQLGV
ncbi:hypothetical protein RCCS2_07459 [Roseobacter sp. CCS2]|nr:hypothetical protein RCCS2_07459 [Roseobacter sp. CCS2]